MLIIFLSAYVFFIQCYITAEKLFITLKHDIFDLLIQNYISPEITCYYSPRTPVSAY